MRIFGAIPLALLSCVANLFQCQAFTQIVCRKRAISFTFSKTRLATSAANETAVGGEPFAANKVYSSWSEDSSLEGSEIVHISLNSHKPLGCTVEESLGLGEHVFISKIVEGGKAQNAGLLVGDVLVGVTSATGDDLSDVMGLGIDKVKGLVGSRPKEETLHLAVARNSKVLEEHEEAVVELCGKEDNMETETDQCVVDYLSGGYDITMDDDEEEEEETSDTADQVAEEDLVDNLYNMWADDLPESPNAVPEQVAEESKPKAKPWSSRSSPSGTFVRDPTTGEMRNIDA